MASQINLNSGQWTPQVFVRFYQLLAIFYLLSIVQLCRADSSNENVVKYSDNNVLNTDFIPYKTDTREPYNEEIRFKPSYSYSKIPFEILYKMINENQYASDPMERFRKYDPSDRSFIRFGRSDPKLSRQSKNKMMRQYFNYMKRPAHGDTSFIRFGKRSVNSQ